MNIEFTSAHMETLMELKQLAEKHGCRITFGVDSWAGVDPEFEEFDGYTSEIYEELNDKGIFSNGVIDMSKFWFEFYDPNNKERQYHYLEYSEGEQTITYELYALEELSLEELSEEAEEFIAANRADWDDNGIIEDSVVLFKRLGGTTIKGFYGLEHPNVYREGMALKFFGDLVCDYLGEKRIVRTY